jgi:hypothetical protein
MVLAIHKVLVVLYTHFDRGILHCSVLRAKKNHSKVLFDEGFIALCSILLGEVGRKEPLRWWLPSSYRGERRVSRLNARWLPGVTAVTLSQMDGSYADVRTGARLEIDVKFITKRVPSPMTSGYPLFTVAFKPYSLDI